MGKDAEDHRTNQGDTLLQRADQLVGAAHSQAIAMFTALSEKFPILLEVNVEHFDFVLTVGGVFIAATRLNNLHLGNELEERLMEVVAERLNEWKPDGISAFEDCKTLFERVYDQLSEAGHEPRFVATDALGTWIVWNVFKRPPETAEERTIVRATGGMVTHAFFDWWGE